MTNAGRAVLTEQSLINDQQQITTVPGPLHKRMRPEPLIRVLVEDNPKRLGSAAYTRFTFYEDGITVGEYFRRGGKPEDLKWDEEHRYIRLDKYFYLR